MKQPLDRFKKGERGIFHGAIEKRKLPTTRTHLPKNRLSGLLELALALTLCTASLGTPFNGEFRFGQPDGTQIVLHGQGDEFYSVFETLEGYTVMFVPEPRAYYYARLSADGTALESTGAMVGRDAPDNLGLARHLRIAPEAARVLAVQKFESWDKATGLSKRWAGLKTQTLRTGLQLLKPPCKAK